jgi:Secretion system C-terminal sorting domain
MKLLYFTLLFSYFTCTGQFTPQGINEFPDATNLHLLHDIEDPTPMVLSIYPNPMKSESKIIISNSEASVNLHVYDTYGREIVTMKSNSNSIVLQRDKLGPGMYKLALVTDQGTFFQKQILVVE